MAEDTPVTYEDLPDELKKKHDEIKATLEAELIGSFHRTRSHGVRWKGFTPEGALDGVDLSAPSEERTRSLRQEINYMVAHSLHRHSESLVNTLERVALRVVQEIMSHRSIEHVSRYLAQLGTISASDELRVRFFAQSLTGSAFGWYTSLPPNSIRTWKQLEEQFHEQYHSEASDVGIADLAQVRQKRGETVSEYVQRFRTIRNRCFSAHISEKEAVELAVVGLSSSIKDVASQAHHPSLAHMVQKLSAYEQRHPDVYQDKFKRTVTLVEADEDEGAAGDREVAVAEWTRGGPVTANG
ncbi:hypothetical protein QYE76_062241 [Lolium multiflorum]|uniref:Retrotransposon gag domain-containing protein n=1 Tax=Lolium multiflorum TaxID=4521 RepID=A0AAD8S2B6_LOLMU|nr:hypothetical protein QYE76_062241 [Lolium multiflorum]